MWNYYRDESNDPLSTNSESFKYKTSIVGKTPPNNDSLTDAEVVIPLKYLSNFWRSLDIPLINREIELILTWTQNCMFQLLQRIEDDDIKKDYRDSFSHYYVRKVQIKDFSVLIDGKKFFDLSIKK